MAHGPRPQSTARIFGHPLHPMLIPFPMVLFISAFVTDLAFLRTGDIAWSNGSRWLLGAGLVGALLAAATGLADFSGDQRIRKIGMAWGHMIGNVAAVLLEIVNLALRLGDRADDAVSPTGVILSGLVVLLLGFTGWAGGELVYRHGVAVDDGHLGETVRGDSSARQ